MKEKRKKVGEIMIHFLFFETDTHSFHLKYLGKLRNTEFYRLRYMREKKSVELKFFFVINHIVGGTPAKEREERGKKARII